MKKVTFALVSILSQAAQLALAVPAFTREQPMLNAIRMEAKDTTAATRTIQGTLLCSMGAENTGQPCELKLRETGTDRVYGISASNQGRNELMRLFQAGTREVAVEARIAGTTLEISNAQGR